METIVGLSNIGAFFLQAVTLGQGVRSNTTNVETVLRDAYEVVDGAMEQLMKYKSVIDAKEYKKLRVTGRHLLNLIEEQIESTEQQHGFFITITSYKRVKKQAREQWCDSHKFKRRVKAASRDACDASDEPGEVREEDALEDAEGEKRLARLFGKKKDKGKKTMRRQRKDWLHAVLEDPSTSFPLTLRKNS
ncbi:hypothetical protein Hypma_007482 [Hypsizygus marmoreus]|uniref:Uncharacterized protein n=1 Tax=Hypsizygus marmoreus TaxID=39966 RepID=A0A369JSL4_HYPMA|nr:hypothetical protein Hypma_007482 [Hypsizygus marmoreus]